MKKGWVFMTVVVALAVLACVGHVSANTTPDFDGDGTVAFPDFLLFVGGVWIRSGR